MTEKKPVTYVVQLDGGAAFPESVSADAMGGLNFSRERGMSLRDYFAGQALAGMLAAVKRSPKTPEQMADFFAGAANTAYLQADAMLAERAK